VPIVKTAYQAQKAVAYASTGQVSKAITATKKTGTSLKKDIVPIALTATAVAVPALAPMAVQSILSRSKLPMGLKVKKPTLSNIMNNLSPTNLMPTEGTGFKLPDSIRTATRLTKGAVSSLAPSSNFSAVPEVQPAPYTNPFPTSDFTTTVSTQPPEPAKSPANYLAIGLVGVAIAGIALSSRKK
jgi:hypothetical protein